VTCGTTSGKEVKLNIRLLYGQQRSILGSFMGGRGELMEAFRLIAQRNLEAVIDLTFPLKEAASAQKIVRSCELCRKILLHT
jgi:NADPH:quinone reductase-like Zn-dependent oxidoreductase